MSRLCQECQRRGRTRCMKEELVEDFLGLEEGSMSHTLEEDFRREVEIVIIGFEIPGRGRSKPRPKSYEEVLQDEIDKEAAAKAEAESEAEENDAYDFSEDTEEEQQAEDAEWEEAEELVEQD